jgi:glyoxylase-like metal-dependent hydrolase (beta-lactamase superfamily II)
MTPTRRAFLFASANPAIRAAAAAGPESYAIEKIAPGAWFAQAAPNAVFNCNVAIFEQSAGLVVVDANNTPSLAESLIVRLDREVSRKPVHTVVYSHFHFDHVQGTAAYRKRWPDVQIVAARATKSLLEENGKAWVETTVAGAEKLASSSPDPAVQEQARAYVRDMKGALPLLPTRTFTDELTLPDSRQPLELRFAGRGHTAGDLLVWSPSRKVLATGDFAHESGLPFLSDAYVHEWVPALRRWADLGFAAAIGGHGPAFDRRAFTDRAAYLEELVEAVEKAKAAGKTVQTLAAELTPDKLKSLASGYGERLGLLVKKANPALQVSPLQALAPNLRANVNQLWARLSAEK